MAIGAVIIDVKSNTTQAQAQFQSLQKSATASFAAIAKTAERSAHRARRAMAETSNAAKTTSNSAAQSAISAADKIGAAFNSALIQVGRQGMALGNALNGALSRDFSAPLASGLSRMPPLLAGATLGVLALGSATLAAAVQATRLGDEYGQNMAKITNAVKDTGESSRAVYAELRAVAQNLAVPMSETVQSFSRIKTAINQLGGSAADALKITNTLGMALQVSGASTAESAAAMQQFGQALASGVLQGDEFKSLTENASYLMVSLAKNLGVTTGELRKMSREGKLTADVLAQAMHDMSD